MSNIALPVSSQWGHKSPEIEPSDMVNCLKEQVQKAMQDWSALPDGPEPCNDQNGYHRVSVEIPLTNILFDQLMNGATGYRAHYSVGMECGERFNRWLVDAVAPVVIRSENLYINKFDQLFCRSSLLGRCSKFWFPKELTDPSAESQLLNLPEELSVPQWVKYWRERTKPRKGLLAPVPKNLSILLNGTFVNEAGEVYEQKPDRSKQIFETGWT